MQHNRRYWFVLSVFLFTTPAPAATITVNTAENELFLDGDCSLHEAIQSANSNLAVDNCVAGDEAAVAVDEIVFDASLDGTPIAVNTSFPGTLYIIESVTVTGNGIAGLETNNDYEVTGYSAHTLIEATGISRVFDVDVDDEADEVTFQKLAVTGGNTAGAAIRATGPSLTLTLRDTVFASLHSESALAPFGGAVSASNDSVRVLNSLFIDNTMQMSTPHDAKGGAIGLDSSVNSVEIRNSAFFRNTAQSSRRAWGGAISAEDAAEGATSVIENSVFGSNRAVDDTDSVTDADDHAIGGALYLYGSVPHILSSSFFNNSAETQDRLASGGAVLLEAPVGPVANVFINNSTFSGNAATAANVDSFAQGGALALSGIYESVMLNNTTVTGNTADTPGTAHGGGLYSDDLNTDDGVAPLFITNNTLIAGNTEGGADSDSSPDCAAVVESTGYTLLGNNNGGFCDFTQTVGDQVGDVAGGGDAIDPGLDALADNGGGPEVDGHAIPLPTHRPMDESPVLDAGDPNAPADGGDCLDSDARGVERPQDGDEDGAAVCDIGAVEVEEPNTPPEVADPLDDLAMQVGDNSVEIDLAGTFNDPDGDTLNLSVTPGETGFFNFTLSDNTLTLTPTATGSTTVTVTAEDPRGATASDEFELTVTPAPDPDSGGSSSGGSSSGGGGGGSLGWPALLVWLCAGLRWARTRSNNVAWPR